MYFDIKQRNAKPILYLSKPDRTTIARLSEARQETETFNGGQLNELSFVLPLKHQTLEENRKNLHAEMVRERMIIKLREKETNQERFYVITGFNFDMDALTVTVSCKSSGYTLSDIPIKGFSTVENDHPDGLDMSSWTLSEIVRATIDRDEDTPWRLGNVDVEFDLKRREFTFDGSLGELVVSAAEKFGAVPDYDDDNYLVHFHDPENMGRNRGLKISERNYMKSLSKDTNADSMVTQLALYGKDGLTIHDVSPTGSPYIEDFSHFLYPYEEDEQGNIIKSSYFMSDSLAQAMVTYNRKILSLTPTFETMLTQLNALMDEVTVQENLLADLDIELTQVQERIDIHLALNNGVSNAEFEADKTRILGEKIDVNSTIDSLKSDISNLAGENYYDFGFVPANESGGEIGRLKEQMLVRNNFTPAQIAERSHFIIRKEWTNDSITEAKDLLEEGRKQLKEMIKPNINFSLGLVDFLSMVETPTVHKEVYMWDEIRIEEPWNKKASTARITGITRNYDTKELTFTITNVKDNNDGTNKFLQMLYQSSFAATVVNENKYKWDKSEENAGQLNALINSNFDAIGKKVTGGVAGLTEFSARGVISRDYEDHNRYLVLQNGILATTKNGGVSWGHAITPDGIVGERIFGKILAGVNLTIEDQDGMFRVLGNKVIISNRDGREVSRLGLISQDGQPDRFGFVVDNGKNQIGIEDKDGFFISRYQGDTLERLLWTDSQGNLNAQKITATDIKIVNGDMRSAVVKNEQGDVIVKFDSTGLQINNASLVVNGGLTDENISSAGSWNAKETPSGAQAKIDAAKKDLNTAIENVSLGLNTFQGTVNGSFRDGIINNAETLSIKSNIEVLESQKSAFDTQYSKVYNDTSLSAAIKPTILSAYNTFVADHNSLIAAINTAISDNVATEAEKTNVTNKFNTYRASLSVLQGRIEDGIKDIANKYATDAETRAKSYTDTAKTDLTKAIGDVSQNLTTFEQNVNGSFKDGIISNAETLSIKSNIEMLNSQKSSLDTQHSKIYNDTNLSAALKPNILSAYNTFVSAHNALITSINSAISDNVATTAEKTDVENKFTTYRTALAGLQGRIEDGIKDIANKYATNAEANAKTYTDAAKTEIQQSITTVSINLSTFEQTVNGTFKDGVISNAEALSIKSNIDLLNTSKDSMTTQYNKVYGDSLLSGTPKTNLASAKTAFDTSHTNLINAINTATSDNAITSTERTDVSNKFADYRTKLNTYQQRIDEAWTFVYNKYSETKANDAVTSVKTSLRVAADLPTSISMGTFGIRATTTDATKYAQLDYRGLYIKGGAIQIDAGTNGVSLDAANGLVVDGARAKVEISAEKGFRLTNKNGDVPVFWVDTNGTLNINNVSINGGSISWGLVNAPPSTGVESWEDLQDKPTYLEQYRIWSPEIVGGTIRSATLETGTIESSAINSATINSGTTGGVGSVYIENGTILNSRRYYESLDDGGYEQINRHIKVESGKIELFGATWDNRNNITASIFIDPNFSAGSLNLKSGKWIKFTTFNQSSPIMTMSTADVRVTKRFEVADFTTLGGGADISFGLSVSGGMQVTYGGLGVGGAYQNATNPTNTSIGATNVFVPNAVYAKGVSLTSSVVYKTNVKPLSDGALNLVKDIMVYEYHYQDDIDNLNFENKQIGVLAESVPSILRAGENRSVNPYAITMLLFKAVQEQQVVIEQLQERVSVLEEIQ